MADGVDEPLRGMPNVSFGNVVGGDFMVIRLLSRGSAGTLYLAEQLSTASHRALKILCSAYVSDETLFKRFEREAQMASRIPSDHVVQMIASGVDEKLRAPWIAMELLSGQHLGDYIQERGPASADFVKQVFEQLCHALAEAHALGVVHRDLKPANIFLSETRRVGAETMVKVLDFGVASVLKESLTVAGSPLGTPNWMSPEQTRGIPVTAATDVWALGLIAFYMLTGRIFWRSSGELNADFRVMKEIAEEPMPIASMRALELDAYELLPAGFDEWFAQCTARDPKERFVNARAAYAALAQTLQRSASR